MCSCHLRGAHTCAPARVLCQVDIHTDVGPRDMPSVYKCADVFVAPYVRNQSETFALANLEAMAMGVPFVHFGTGGIRVRGPRGSRTLPGWQWARSVRKSDRWCGDGGAGGARAWLNRSTRGTW